MHNASADFFDIATLLKTHESERYDLHTRYLNDMMVRALRTIGFDVAFQRGTGQYHYDKAGARYLDLLSGWGVFAVGRNHPTVRAALQCVIEADLPNLVQMDVTTLAGLLAERLLHFVPYLDKVFFANSGTEAVEAAIKFARGVTGRQNILYCSNAFHGLTYGALSLNGDATFREGFGGFLPGCQEVRFNDLEALERALASREIAAFFVEPIQGKGVNVADDDYLKGVRALCSKYGTLFVADEIQTGLGRTGRFLATEHWNVEPDMVLLAKALSGGHVPIGAVLMRKKIFEATFNRMDRMAVHGSTFAKNDLAMAAGLATLEIIKSERLIENAARQGQRLFDFFGRFAERYELVKTVRGKGLMIGLEFGPPHSFKLKTAWTLLESVRAGLFCQLIIIPLFKDHKIVAQVAANASHTIKLLPPLNISDADCTWIEQAFDSVVADAHRVPGAIWSLGRTLAENVRRSSKSAG
ncbi:aspartate aminotransferase family protein [uncultured Methylovirgula sp.]|uniref:aspartate aminotransferase family protein n=1 Tax=uncultured Methylovirgula sp. TaxID=1285960 RepID=UPI0026077725|nr:aspartate aminotransferase family protein [uncultured Methylovirgula sp.]